MILAHSLLAALSPHQPTFVALAMLAVIPLTWRTTGPPERATALTLGGVAVLDLAAWWFGNGAPLLHAMADSLALGWMVPVALRANRFYPAVVSAALLIAVAIEWLDLLGLVQQASSTEMLVGIAHLLALVVYLLGWTGHRSIIASSGRRPAWRDQIVLR